MTTLATIIGVLAGLAALLIIAIHVYAYSFIWLSACQLRRELRRHQRTVSRTEAQQRITRHEGIILVDAPSIGWNVTRIWWSPETDFVPPSKQTDQDSLASPADIENHRRFIDMTTGTASLVEGLVFSQRTGKYLKKHFGLDDCPFIFTGGVVLEQKTRTRK
jgi:hypothetical protein